jgi:NADH dehydrogenase [ubiquinone] 1 alpha subcomplex assembly factor 7
LSLHWSSVIETALYGPSGFYRRSARHYLTSPTVSPLFGAVVARAIDSYWSLCGCPAQWDVIEFGSGSGALQDAILGASPTCPLRYTAVEFDDPVPSSPVTGVILANELLDNLPFDVYMMSEDGWVEMLVSGVSEIPTSASAAIVAALRSLAPLAIVGDRVPWQIGAQNWLASALSILRQGTVLVFDYGRQTAELAGEGGWMRTYRDGGPGGEPLENLGSQDITVDVALDQLALVRAPTRMSTQRDWLDRYGISSLVPPLGALDLAGLRARSVAMEAAALRDPAGLGGFAVLEWDVSS